jgi:hypothetical protein
VETTSPSNHLRVRPCHLNCTVYATQCHGWLRACAPVALSHTTWGGRGSWATPHPNRNPTLTLTHALVFRRYCQSRATHVIRSFRPSTARACGFPGCRRTGWTRRRWSATGQPRPLPAHHAWATCWVARSTSNRSCEAAHFHGTHMQLHRDTGTCMGRPLIPHSAASGVKLHGRVAGSRQCNVCPAHAATAGTLPPIRHDASRYRVLVGCWCPAPGRHEDVTGVTCTCTR